MPKQARELGPLDVQRLSKTGLHAVGRVPGLYLQVLASGARTWILRIVVGGKRRDMGLGGYPAVTLAQAREAAQQKRVAVSEGRDPIEERRAAQSALKASRAAAVPFKQCCLSYIEAHEAGWRNKKHAQQWRNTLETYAFPAMGQLLVRDVSLPNILAVLEPIWRSKTETASRLRGRLELVLDWATARGFRDGLNPARWRGHLDKLLPRPSKVATSTHHIALPLSEIGAFMQLLRAAEGMGARALEFAILTAARSGEVRGAVWGEIDLDNATWAIPGARMKAGKDHRVPLSAEAVDLLRKLPRMANTDLVFPAPRSGKLSDMTLTAVLRRMDVAAVPHGFRSTFRDWASERTNYPNELAEMALAHAIGDKVEAAYRRGDMFEKRRRMMSDWAAFVDRVEMKASVLPMKQIGL